jgi:membrane protein
VIIVLALTTLYKLALPRKLPWHRGLPGAVLAMIVFLLSSIGLRLYISWITTTGYTYGALATPIAFLLFVFFIGLAIVIGAYFNSAIQELWPARMTRRQRRKWRRLEMGRAALPPATPATPAPQETPAAPEPQEAPAPPAAPAPQKTPATPVTPAPQETPAEPPADAVAPEPPSPNGAAREHKPSAPRPEGRPGG